MYLDLDKPAVRKDGFGYPPPNYEFGYDSCANNEGRPTFNTFADGVRASISRTSAQHQTAAGCRNLLDTSPAGDRVPVRAGESICFETIDHNIAIVRIAGLSEDNHVDLRVTLWSGGDK
jgi:hypothetical protein